MRTAGAEQAQLIMFCIDDAAFGPDELAPIRRAFPQARVFVRAFDRRQMMSLGSEATDYAVREVFESAVLMGRLGLAALGARYERVDEVERGYRDQDLDLLEEQTSTGDPYAGGRARLLVTGEVQ